jgi:dihydropteroate synthase
MQIDPRYENVSVDVVRFLRERVVVAEQEGISRTRLCVDPGFGFGNKVEDNLVLLNNLAAIVDEVGLPLLAGLSRKSTVGAITGKPVEHRLAGSIAAALVAVAHGASIVRVHDVAETVDALRVWHAGTNNNQGIEK